VRAQAALHRVDGGRGVDREHAQALIALLPRHRLADDARSLERGLEAVTLQAAQVQQHILHAVIGDDEAIAAAHVEPLDQSAHLHDADIVVGGFNLCRNLVAPYAAVRRHVTNSVPDAALITSHCRRIFGNLYKSRAFVQTSHKGWC